MTVMDDIQRGLNKLERELSRAITSPIRMSIRMGHWKDYRANGLFGKHYGIYWWDDATKPRTGRESKGTRS